MGEFISVLLTLIVALAALNAVLIRLHIKDWKAKHEGEDPASDLLGDALEEDMDAKAMVTRIATIVTRQDDALKILLEDYHLRKADERAGDLPPL